MHFSKTAWTIAEIRQKKQAIIDLYGPWDRTNILLAEDLYTIAPDFYGEDWAQQIRRFTRIVADIANRPLHELRLLDLACYEGLYALEFALQGAESVGIEGRKGNVTKAQFVKDVLGLDNLTFYYDDVLNLNPAQHGVFDVILCSGILYHLTLEGVVSLVQKMYDQCTRGVILDTLIRYEGEEEIVYDGTTYYGTYIQEHSAETTVEDREMRGLPNASIYNISSFQPTRPTLYNLLSRVGFTSVYECQTPIRTPKHVNRTTLVCLKGAEINTFHMAPELSTPDRVSNAWSEDATHLHLPSSQGIIG